MSISVNFHIVTASDAYVSARDRGFLLGDGIFETIKFINGELLDFLQHYSRMKNSALFLKIPFHFEANALLNHIVDLLQKNDLLSRTAVVRITLTRGVSERGINIESAAIPTLSITTNSYTLPKKAISGYITSVIRNEFSPLVQHKTIQYLEPILARQEAIENGFDEGIMVNTKNNITEASVANIFAIQAGKLLTPPISDGLLPGIVRQKIIDFCEKNSIPIKITSLTQEHLLHSDFVFLTNSLIGAQVVSKINNQIFEKNHAVFNLIKKKLFDNEGV